jgi:hypothetical protein
MLDDAAEDLSSRADRMNFVVGVPLLLIAIGIGVSGFYWIWSEGLLDGSRLKFQAAILAGICIPPIVIVIPLGRRLARIMARRRRPRWVQELARLHDVPEWDLDKRTREWF